MSLPVITSSTFTTSRAPFYDRPMDEQAVLLPDATDRDGAFVFLVGTILNQNITGRLAWQGVQRLAERGFGSPQQVCGESRPALLDAIRRAPAVHPFATAMADAISSAAEHVAASYDGDARLIWQTAASRDELVQRLVAFRQIGTHKTAVAIYLLAEAYSAVPREYGSTNRIKALCPSAFDLLSSESWAIRRPEHAGTHRPDL